jgi:hypothetical protein
MNTTTYAHFNHEEEMAVTVDMFLQHQKALMVSYFNKGSQVSTIFTPEQLLQLHATLGEFIKDKPELFVNKSITELEEIKND